MLEAGRGAKGMEYLFSKLSERVKTSAVREILKLTQGESVISFAGGLPSEELFPVEAVRKAFLQVFEGGNRSLQYGLTEGFMPLRAAIADRMAKKGMAVEPDQVLLATGSQQVLDLVTRVLIDPDDVILVENPTYLAALQVFSGSGATVVPIAGDENGPDVADLVAKISEYKPRLFYAIPTFSNPTGAVWSIGRRLAILEACRAHDVVILEDDPYGELQFDPSLRIPTLYALQQQVDGAVVVYTSTFSKIVAPAVRTGWVTGPAEIISAVARAKQSADLHSSSLDQQALYFLLRDFDLDGHIANICHTYKDQMDWMTRLLADYRWPGVTWNRPAGGMFLWLKLPPEMNAERLLKIAVAEGVAFVPGFPFYASDPHLNTLRMNYTHGGKEEIREGMIRFARAFELAQRELVLQTE